MVRNRLLSTTRNANESGPAISRSDRYRPAHSCVTLWARDGKASLRFKAYVGRGSFLPAHVVRSGHSVVGVDAALDHDGWHSRVNSSTTLSSFKVPASSVWSNCKSSADTVLGFMGENAPTAMPIPRRERFGHGPMTCRYYWVACRSLWARFGHAVGTTAHLGASRKLLHAVTRKFVVGPVRIEMPISAFACLCLLVPEVALDQVFCGARWNRTIGLSIISAAGVAFGGSKRRVIPGESAVSDRGRPSAIGGVRGINAG